MLKGPLLAMLFILCEMIYAMESPPLLNAVCNGNVKQVKELMLNGADVNAYSRYYNTPLHNAIWFGFLSIVHELLQHPQIDVNAAPIHKISPLDLAIAVNNKEMVHELFQKPDIDMDAPKLLLLAKEKGNTEIIKMMQTHLAIPKILSFLRAAHPCLGKESPANLLPGDQSIHKTIFEFLRDSI